MVGKILIPEIQAMVEARNFAALRALFSEMPPADVAEIILDLPEDERVIIFRILPNVLAADVFEYLDLESQQQLLRGMAHEQVVSLLNEMSPDDRTALLEELPSAAARQLIQLLTPDERKIAQALLGYPEGSVGRLMTPDFIAAREDWTVQQVLDYVREHGQDRETLNFVYVVDDKGRLIDDLRMREFLLRPLTTKVGRIMDRSFVHLTANETQGEALNIFRKYDRAALPVVDSANVLVGIVTVDDMLDVAEEEATEDIQKIGGIEALDEPYMRIPLWKMVRKRAGWLVILFLGEMLTATAMSNYEDEIAKAVVLALFLPLIISSGGNSGSQASTLIIRAMALGEVGLRDWWRVASRELQAGFSLGLILGTDRGDSGHGLVRHWREIFSSRNLWAPLAAGRAHRRYRLDRCGAVGFAFRIDAAVPAPAIGSRSGYLFRTICRHIGRCNRIGDLLQHRVLHHARCNAVAGTTCAAEMSTQPLVRRESATACTTRM